MKPVATEPRPIGAVGRRAGRRRPGGQHDRV